MADSSAGSATLDSSAVREAIEDRVSQPNGALISGRYRIEGVLGSGGMGTVYLAQHIHMRKRVALKMLHAETSQVPELVARFEREAVAMSRAEHPNIAIATDFGRADNGAFFLVLEYIEGYSLRNAMATGPLEAARAMHIARQIAGALERSHELGIIHRDLKPENIMLVPRQGDFDFVKILDFGLAKLAPEAQELDGDEPERSITRHGSVFGTPRYMAPEQCLGETVDGRSDLYSLGLILYEALTGLHPFDERDPRRMLRHHLVTPIPPMQQRAPGVSVAESIEALVMRLIEKPRSRRPASASEFLGELSAVCEIEGISNKDTSARQATPRTAMPAPGSIKLPTRPLPREVPTDAMATQDVSSDETQAIAASMAAHELALPAAAQAVPLLDPTQPPEPPSDPPPDAVQTLLQSPAVKAPPPPPPPALLHRQSLLLLLPSVLLALCLGWLLVRPNKAANVPITPGVTTQAARDPRRPLASPSAGSPSDVASQAQIDAAKSAGTAALLDLIKTYPSDAQLPKALAVLYLAQGNGIEALRWQAKALTLSEGAIYDGEIVRAATLALGSTDSSEAAIAMLEKDFGARGVDVLFALSAKPGPMKNRIARSLGKPEVREHASPATLIALDLRAATRCDAKHALLARAAQYGDHRALQQLKPLVTARGCGPIKLGDCWACLRKDSALRSAISSIDARSSLAH